MYSNFWNQSKKHMVNIMRLVWILVGCPLSWLRYLFSVLFILIFRLFFSFFVCHIYLSGMTVGGRLVEDNYHMSLWDGAEAGLRFIMVYSERLTCIPKNLYLVYYLFQNPDEHVVFVKQHVHVHLLLIKIPSLYVFRLCFHQIS